MRGLTLAMLLAQTACTQDAAMNPPPPPAQAVRYAEYPFGTTTQSLEGALELWLRELSADGESLVVERLALPTSTAPDDVLGHYRQALGGEWRVDPAGTAPEPAPYWSYRLTNGPRAVVFGAVEPRAVSGQQTPLVVIASGER